MKQWPKPTDDKSVLPMAKELSRQRAQDVLEHDKIKGRNFADYRSFATATASGDIGAAAVTYLDATAGDLANVLPDPTRVAGQCFTTKRTDASGHTVTITARGAGTIDGAANYTLAAGKSRTVQSNGIEYKSIGSF